MRKQSLLVTLILIVALTITACGQKNPFPGTWRGTCDLTDFIVSVVSGGDEEIAQYLNFEDLSFEYVYEFTESDVVVSVDDASFEKFSNSFKNGFFAAVKEKITNDLQLQGLTYEEYLEDSGLEEAELLASNIENVDLDTWISSIRDVAELMAYDGAYMYRDDTLTILHENGTYHKLNYTIDGKTLTIIISDGEIELPIVCEKVK